MLTKKLTIIFVSALFVMLSMFLSSPLLAAQTEKAPGITEAVFGWKLTNARVLNGGQSVTIDDGLLITGYVVEATATAVSGFTPIKMGTFRITASIFSPTTDMPGQKAGTWYIQGKWTIAITNATAAQMASRHSAAVMRGDVAAALDFNPCTTAGTISGQVNLPMSPNGGKWTKGKGTFIGNEKFEGTIAIDTDVWPVVSAAGR